MSVTRLEAISHTIDAERAPELFARYQGLGKGDARALAVAIVAAYPAFAPLVDARPAMFDELAREGWRLRRSPGALRKRLFAAAGDFADADAARARLADAVTYEKLRVATRELLPRGLGGADVDETSKELSDLAAAAIDVAFEEARAWAIARFGRPVTASGERSRFVVLGMGKLGGRELNAGSDVDLIYFYDTDDGEVLGPDGPTGTTLHELWARVARRLTETIDGATPSGTVWRVDLRLRPEGSTGPIANSLPAAERYYETFGRMWERAAMLRARPVAGDVDLGDEALAELSPFVYARNVAPSLAIEMARLVERSRVELSEDPERDLKLGKGGIREAEFFVQSLQLIWGGREPRVRATNTLDALRRLRARGLVTDREARDVAEAYLLFRETEHRVQFATGVQTHLLPTAADARARLARSLGYVSDDAFFRDLAKARARVAARFASLAPGAANAAQGLEGGRFEDLLARLDGADLAPLEDAVARVFGPQRGNELARDLRQLARRPEDLLGGATRERFPELVATFLAALVDAADPEQAARLVRTRLARLSAPGLYVHALAEAPRAARRLVAVLGASSFLGSAIANRPELGDDALFSRAVPTPELARAEVEAEVAQLRAGARPADDEDDEGDRLVGALRRAQTRMTIEVGIADLAEEIETRAATSTLSALADAILERATRFALEAEGPVRGLAVLAVGKLGGNEIGYGSDLDVLFVFDPAAAPPGVEAGQYFGRRAQRIISLVAMPHAEGPGYQLDTRLRPSGSHGLLVTSLESFARYHAVAVRGLTEGDADVPVVLASGAAWERQALIRARACAGDRELGAAAIRIAHVAAYERGAPKAAELHAMRMRIERELARERPGRYDPKLGRGGIADVEFAVQYLQMLHGADARVRTTETTVAISRLAELGHLSPDAAETLRQGHRFLRYLEQRVRIVHGAAVCLLDEDAEGLVTLARRMGLRDGPSETATEALLTRYRDVTEAVRAAYLEVVGAEG